ncbi:MAG: hypothetical protein IPO92_20495 [Saprospiraceae bacterium]|nr:hypothetical protein [Saprospiraceae bacterium]
MDAVSQAVKYKYKLESIDIEWRYTTDQKLIYPNLSPGNYCFILECSINDNFDFVDKFEVAFTIKPAYWQTLWFKVLVSFVLGLIGYFVLTRSKMRQKLLDEIKTDQLKNQRKR